MSAARKGMTESPVCRMADLIQAVGARHEIDGHSRGNCSGLVMISDLEELAVGDWDGLAADLCNDRARRKSWGEALFERRDGRRGTFHNDLQA